MGEDWTVASPTVEVIQPPGRSRQELVSKQQKQPQQDSQRKENHEPKKNGGWGWASVGGRSNNNKKSEQASLASAPTRVDETQKIPRTVMGSNKNVLTVLTAEAATETHQNQDNRSVPTLDPIQRLREAGTVAEDDEDAQQQEQKGPVLFPNHLNPSGATVESKGRVPEEVVTDYMDEMTELSPPPGLSTVHTVDSKSARFASRMDPTPESDQGQQQEASWEELKGTILEAAFVDPAYSWPPVDGEGRNAIELQASLSMLEDDDNSVRTTQSLLQRMEIPPKPTPVKRKVRTVTNTVVETKKKSPWWKCCVNKDAVVEQRPVVEETEETVLEVDPAALTAYEEKKRAALAVRKMHEEHKRSHRERLRQRERELRQEEKYNRVPEGILIYRLDTGKQWLQLVSTPHTKTDLTKIPTEMRISRAEPSPDKSRRGMILYGMDGKEQFTLIACEQRTATAWLEAMNIMFAKKEKRQRDAGTSIGTWNQSDSNRWIMENFQEPELDRIENEYLNLAHYSHKLIRAGALPGGKKGAGGAGGIYYSVDRVTSDNSLDDDEDEALEAIAKRRAVIKDSWDFFRMICSLLRDRNKYQEVFRRMQLDPVYPYLNSMTGLNDPGDAGYENLDKAVRQRELPEYESMTRMEIANHLVTRAEAAMPSLVEICKALAGSLGMEEVGVGPIKEPEAALRKAEKKYGGDLFKVTDYCRALLVVKDFPSLLALLELARDSFGPLIRRVKMSTLKSHQQPKPGGYRDCIINVELKEHVCEIQVHLWPMWQICGVDGFRHYRHCVEYNTDSFVDAYDALDGLDRKTMAEIIVMAEEAVAESPLENLEWYHEKFILDYFAEAGLFMRHGLDVWAEITFRHLVRLRTESPDIGPDHHETMILYKYLAQTLVAQGKNEEAQEIETRIRAAEVMKQDAKKDARRSLWDSLAHAPYEALDMIMDPNKKEREEEQRVRKEVKASKKRWRRIRKERFPFLDEDMVASKENAGLSDDQGSKVGVRSYGPNDETKQSLNGEEKKLDS